jgi:hypothetical protein
MATPQTRSVICPYCGLKNYAVITYCERVRDNDWDDGTCVGCAMPIVSERCASIFMVRAPSAFDAHAGRW